MGKFICCSTPQRWFRESINKTTRKKMVEEVSWCYYNWILSSNYSCLKNTQNAKLNLCQGYSTVDRKWSIIKWNFAPFFIDIIKRQLFSVWRGEKRLSKERRKMPKAFHLIINSMTERTKREIIYWIFHFFRLPQNSKLIFLMLSSFCVFHLSRCDDDGNVSNDTLCC